MATPAADTAPLAGPGCYSFVDTVNGTTFPGSTTLPAGTSGEVVSVDPVVPTMSTQTATSIANGVESITDTVTINGTTLGAGNGAPTTATVDWTLDSTPPVAGSCTGVWGNTLTQVATGQLTFTANGSETTPSADLDLNTCYSYTTTLVADTSTPIGDWSALTEALGQPTESVQVPTAPGVATTTSAALVFPHASVTDSVDVTGITGYTGTLDWSLVGPVPTGSDVHLRHRHLGHHAGGGPGSGPGHRQRHVTTGPADWTAPGCYSWADTLAGTFPGPRGGPRDRRGDHHRGGPPADPGHHGHHHLGHGRRPKSISDAVTVGGSGIGTSPAAPTSADLSWTLLGPVAPVADRAPCGASAGPAPPSWPAAP